MKCEMPVMIKNKKEVCQGELKALRTFAEGSTVRRERRCDHCGRKLWTIELFESDLTEIKETFSTKIHELQQELRTQNIESAQIKDAVKTLFQYANKKL